MSSFLLQLRQELKKLFARRRSYLGFGGFLLMEGVILLVVNRAESQAEFRRLLQEHGLEFNHYFSGLTLAAEMVVSMGFIPGALFLALIAGDVMSNEVEEGTLRMVLCRPVSRFRVALLKYVSCLGYTFALIGFLGVTSLAMGIANRGMGGLFVVSASEHLLAWHEPGPGAARFCLAVAFLAVGLLTVTSLGFFFSCFGIKSAAAVVATVAIVFLDFLLSNVPYFETLRPWFLSTHVAGWLQVFANPIPWKKLAEDGVCLMMTNAVLFGIAVTVFQRRDFKE